MLLDRVQRQFEKALPHGLEGKYMQPGLVHVQYFHDKHFKSQRRCQVTWLCIPFFCLETYLPPSLPEKPLGHPLPSLLQARYSSITRDRDMCQDVCELKSAPKGSCFHVSQLWCLLVSDSKLCRLVNAYANFDS